MARTRDPEVRRKIWTFLRDYPGHTGLEITRAALKRRGPTAASTPSVYATLVKMENDGLLRRERKFSPGQGREVSFWFAVPGKF